MKYAMYRAEILWKLNLKFRLLLLPYIFITLFVVFGTTLSGCAATGYRDLKHYTTNHKPSVSFSFVILYGKDRDAPKHPNQSCEPLAEIEYWSRGEKRYPFNELRQIARRYGANGVGHIRFTHRDGHKFFYRATLVKCPSSIFSWTPNSIISHRIASR